MISQNNCSLLRLYGGAGTMSSSLTTIIATIATTTASQTTTGRTTTEVATATTTTETAATTTASDLRPANRRRYTTSPLMIFARRPSKHIIVVITLLTSLSLLDRLTWSQSTEAREYCLKESFNASCHGNDVILMTSASYGRMRLGRCIQGDYNLGCSNDVITHFDALCSGRKTCDVTIRSLVDLRPCQRDYASYLDAGYDCIQVLDLTMTSCPVDGHVVTSATSGYLSNSLYDSYSELGRRGCPWVVRGKEGQRVQLNLILLHTQRASGGPDPSLATSSCPRVIVIDGQTDGSFEYSVCMKRSRDRYLMTSSSHEVTLFTTSAAASDSGAPGGGVGARGGGSGVAGGAQYTAGGRANERKFIIMYKIVGCPLLVLPDNVWVKPMGGPYSDDVMIRCNQTLETWYISCQGDRWMGDYGNCSNVNPAQSNYSRDMLTRATSFNYVTHGVGIALGFGLLLGIVIAMVTLLTACGVQYTCRRRGHGKVSVLFPTNFTRNFVNSSSCPFQHHQLSSSQPQQLHQLEQPAELKRERLQSSRCSSYHSNTISSSHNAAAVVDNLYVHGLDTGTVGNSYRQLRQVHAPVGRTDSEGGGCEPAGGVTYDDVDCEGRVNYHERGVSNHGVACGGVTFHEGRIVEGVVCEGLICDGMEHGDRGCQEVDVEGVTGDVLNYEGVTPEGFDCTMRYRQQSFCDRHRHLAENGTWLGDHVKDRDIRLGLPVSLSGPVFSVATPGSGASNEVIADGEKRVACLNGGGAYSHMGGVCLCPGESGCSFVGGDYASWAGTCGVTWGRTRSIGDVVCVSGGGACPSKGEVFAQSCNVNGCTPEVAHDEIG